MLNLDLDSFAKIYSSYYPDLTINEIKRRYLMFLEMLPFIEYVFVTKQSFDSNMLSSRLRDFSSDRAQLTKEASNIEVKF
jgi:hypothetical protein